jgi:Ca2+/H+ antiporter
MVVLRHFLAFFLVLIISINITNITNITTIIIIIIIIIIIADPRERVGHHVDAVSHSASVRQ